MKITKKVLALIFGIGVCIEARAFEIDESDLTESIVTVEKDGHYFSDCIGIALSDKKILTFSDCVSGTRRILVSKSDMGVSFDVGEYLGKVKENEELFVIRLDQPNVKNRPGLLSKNDQSLEGVLVVYLGRDNKPIVRMLDIKEHFEGGFKTDATNFTEGLDNTRHVFAFDLEGKLIAYLTWAGIWEDRYRTVSSIHSNSLKLENENKRPSEAGAFLGLGDISVSWIPRSENHPLWFPLMLGARYNDWLAGVGFNLIDKAHKYFISHSSLYETSDWKLGAQIGFRAIKFTDDNSHYKYIPEIKVGMSFNSWVGLSIIVFPTVRGVGIGI